MLFGAFLADIYGRRENVDCAISAFASLCAAAGAGGRHRILRVCAVDADRSQFEFRWRLERSEYRRCGGAGICKWPRVVEPLHDDRASRGSLRGRTSNSLGAVSGSGSCERARARSFWVENSRGRIFPTLFAGDGTGNSGVRISRAVVFVSISAELFRRTMGLPRDGGNLVREFPAGLYVRRSFVGARAFGFYGSAIPLVLASDDWKTQGGSMDCARIDCGADAGCVLREFCVSASAAD